jgi:hypothetical protein
MLISFIGNISNIFATRRKSSTTRCWVVGCETLLYISNFITLKKVSIFIPPVCVKNIPLNPGTELNVHTKNMAEKIN